MRNPHHIGAAVGAALPELFSAGGPAPEVLPASGTPRAVVLVLPGGKADSREPSRPQHLSRRRMNPLAAAVHAQVADHGVAVWKVAYRVRGWNEPDRSPVQDARAALEMVRHQHGPVPVVLLGHSMGGRAAVHVLDDVSVVGAVLLCPWLPDEPVSVARGKRIVVAHAATDRWTSPQQSRSWAAAALPLASSLAFVRVPRSGHFMLRRAAVWRDLAVGCVVRALDLEPSVGAPVANVLTGVAAGSTELSV